MSPLHLVSHKSQSLEVISDGSCFSVPRLGQVHFSGPPDSSIRTDDGDDDAKLDESNKLPPLNDRRLQSTNHLGQPNMVEEEICFGMVKDSKA